MNNTNSGHNIEEYINSEDFQKNLENQQRIFDDLFHARRRDIPFSDLDGFLYHYSFVRAGLSSLRKNPDTMNDPDFLELCDTWKHQRFGHIETQRLKELYNKLSEKPVFRENYIFRDLYGNFIKSVYQLFTDEYYTQGFFEIDE